MRSLGRLVYLRMWSALSVLSRLGTELGRWLGIGPVALSGMARAWLFETLVSDQAAVDMGIARPQRPISAIARGVCLTSFKPKPAVTPTPLSGPFGGLPGGYLFASYLVALRVVFAQANVRQR